jgi:hypothetical protein
MGEVNLAMIEISNTSSVPKPRPDGEYDIPGSGQDGCG